METGQRKKNRRENNTPHHNILSRNGSEDGTQKSAYTSLRKSVQNFNI